MRTLAPLPGVRVVASATAFPSDVMAGDAAAAVRFDNAAAHRALLGDDFAAVLAARGHDVDHAWHAHGVRSRDWVQPPGCAPTAGAPTVVDLACAAAPRAQDAARCTVAQIGVLVVATSTPARVTRSLACEVGARLDVDAACFDLRAGGAGGVLAWLDAAAWVHAFGQPALIVAAETPSRYFDAADLATCLVFGDGAAALVLERERDPASARQAGSRAGLLGGVAGRRSLRGRSLTTPGVLPPTAAALARNEYVVRAPDAAWLEALARFRADLDDALRRVCPEAIARARAALVYAASRTQLEASARVLGVSTAAARHTLAAHGALGAASVLAALHELQPQGGDVVLVSATGGSATGAAFAWQWTAPQD